MIIPKLTSENVESILKNTIQNLGEIEQQRIERQTKDVQNRIKQFLEEYGK